LIRLSSASCLAGLALATACTHLGGPPDNGSDVVVAPVDVTQASFALEVLDADELVLLDFWAEWCVPCHEIEPVLLKLASEYRGRVKICRINFDDNPRLVAEYVPDNLLPCLILMKGGRLLERRYGADPKMELEPFFHQWFREHLGSSTRAD
jgi:thioredoxin